MLSLVGSTSNWNINPPLLVVLMSTLEVEMREITKEMLRIYKPLSGLDWLNYKLVETRLTNHHIIKREHGGALNTHNIALLMPIAHQYLHVIEYKDIKTYEAINKMFRYINTQKHEPTMEQREIIEYLLMEFEHDHINDMTSKGKTLIRKPYLNRW